MVAPISFDEWKKHAISKFGESASEWAFKCPCCGNIQTMQQFDNLGVDPNLAYFNCIGRHDGKHGHVDMGTKPGPCNYTGGGLFNMNPVAVIHPETGKTLYVFDFADPAEVRS
jgi:hypothetical protein